MKDIEAVGRATMGSIATLPTAFTRRIGKLTYLNTSARLVYDDCSVRMLDCVYLGT